MTGTEGFEHVEAEVTIIIPSWNGRALLGQCLDGVARLTDPPCTAIVVDDASDDGTAEWLMRHYGWVTVIRQAHRSGFAAAVNVGLRHSATPFVALLNNDAVPDPRWLGASVRTLVAMPEYAACVPRITYVDAPSTMNSAGIYLYWYGASGDIGIGEPDGAPYDTYAEVFGFTGCAVVARREAIELVGELDEWLEAYGEDLDWTASGTLPRTALRLLPRGPGSPPGRRHVRPAACAYRLPAKSE